MRNVTVAKKKLDAVIDRIGDREIRIPIFCRMLNKEFQSLSVKFKSKQMEFYSLSGHYGGDVKYDDEGRYNVFITYAKDEIMIHPRECKDDIFSVMVHEFRHGYQHSKRPKKIFKKYYRDIVGDETFNYLSDYDELDAYAYETAFTRPSWNDWITHRYRDVVGKVDPKIYHRFLTKVYKFTQEYHGR